MSTRRIGSRDWAIAGGLLGMILTMGPAASAAAAVTLPAKAAAAVKEAFPKAAIVDVEVEVENGVKLYEVTLSQNGKKMGVEVTADGLLGEIEQRVTEAEVPKAVADAIAEKARGGRVRRIEKHEVRGITRAGKLIPLETPKTIYEVQIVRNGKREEFEITVTGAATPARDEDEADLPQTVAAAIAKAFPGAKVGEVEVEEELGLILYEVELSQNGKRFELEVAADGTIVEVEQVVEAGELPAAVAKALAGAAKGAKVLKVEKTEQHAAVRLVKLRAPKTTYEVEVLRDGKKVEMRVAADGTVTMRPAGDDDDDDDGDDGDD